MNAFLAISAPEGQRTPSHSPDFTSVDWFGIRYEFSKGQAAETVRLLWQAWENGAHSLTLETIAAGVGSDANRFQLSKVFRSRKKEESGYDRHPALGTMIQESTKGAYRLVEPAPG